MRFEHRAIDTLINSSFLSTEEGGGGLSYLFKDMTNRPKIETPSDLIGHLDDNNIGAAVVSIIGTGTCRVGSAGAPGTRSKICQR